MNDLLSPPFGLPGPKGFFLAFLNKEFIIRISGRNKNVNFIAWIYHFKTIKNINYDRN
jgi:hypothetical protein